MHSIKKILLLSSLLVSSVASHAMTLDEALIAVYKNNPTLKAKRDDLQVTDEQVMKALASGWIPNAAVSLNKEYTKTTGSTAQNGSVDGTVAGLTVTQNIYKSGADLANLQSARSQIKAGRAQLDLQEQDILNRLVSAYMDTLRLYEGYKITQEHEEDAAKSLEGHRQRVSVGMDTKVNLAQFEADFAQAQANRIITKASLDTNKAQLEALVGTEINTLSMPDELKELPKNLPETLEKSLSHNPAVIYFQNTFDAAKKQIDVIRGAVLPSVDLTHTISDYSNSTLATQQRYGKKNYTTSIALKIPLDAENWSALRAQKRQASSVGNSLQAQKDAVKASAVKAWADFQSAKASTVARKEAYNAWKLAYTGSKAKEKVGMVSAFEMIDIRNKYFASYTALIEAKAAYYKSMYNLKAAVGECTAKGLKLDVPLYDPLKNYNSIKWQILGAF